ncbi:MAG: hypothetical protein FWC86_03920 [Coriobacteriia bacterium]|nr:hypothetical protein [Coriobacteriia bacterium]
MNQTAISVVPLTYDEQLKCASFDVHLPPDIPKTSHNLNVDLLFKHYPGLHRHRCLCGKHRSFYDEARQTETAHLLEHLAVELLVLSGVARSVARGETGIPKSSESSLVENRGYRLRFYGADSLDCMEGILRQAAHILDKI